MQSICLLFVIRSHPETTFPDENIQLPALSVSRNPPARPSRAPVKVDEIDRLKKGFWRELNADIQMFPSGNSNFRMETNSLATPRSKERGMCSLSTYEIRPGDSPPP
ncbi:MAG: hypothetical protein C0407_11255 [Desulfobacca sp.]|nr:hypothetical protein [Desulfobacca sp.]